MWKRLKLRYRNCSTISIQAEEDPLTVYKGKSNQEMEFKVDHEEEVVEEDEVDDTHHTMESPSRLVIGVASVDIPVDNDMPLDLSGKLPCQISYVGNEICVETHGPDSRKKNTASYTDNNAELIDSDASSTVSDCSVDLSNLENVVRLPEPKGHSELAAAKRSKEKGRKSRGQLWMFIRKLLLKQDNDAIRPADRLVSWVDREKGIFRIQQTDKLSRLWGTIRDNPTMTYEKLSRGLRHYYKSKILNSVPGRRLTFQFGPRASGWTEID
ncbi:hypothetical protein RvY_00404 [Ramazzottius varieornatus]|uniref:ETS domain-containing protein n=1 Tax=Ramazzottius varieornatus TaxID=947166 RepID=A0A1D1UK06_RAMVA|nr:hypothetical protein RvY_00404 [Ramazzottius varieornatus]